MQISFSRFMSIFPAIVHLYTLHSPVSLWVNSVFLCLQDLLMYDADVDVNEPFSNYNITRRHSPEGAGPDTSDEGLTPLTVAVRCNDMNAVKMLLSHGTVDTVSQHGRLLPGAIHDYLLKVEELPKWQKLKFYYKHKYQNLPVYLLNWQIIPNANTHNHYTLIVTELHTFRTNNEFIQENALQLTTYYK